MDIEELIKKARKGDSEAFYELIKSNEAVLYRTALLYLKNEHDALDAVSETVYKSFISIKKLKEPRYFRTWLIRILINVCLDQIKKSKKIVYVEERFIDVIDFDWDESEDKIDLKKAIDQLDEKEKTVVILKYFHNMTIVEISEVLECPVGTVKTNLHNALEELRLEYKEGSLNG